MAVRTLVVVAHTLAQVVGNFVVEGNLAVVDRLAALKADNRPEVVDKEEV